MGTLLLVGFFALIPTAYAAKIGAPYVPTFKRALDEAFDFIQLGPSDTLVDLGAGDGKVVLLAARRGAKGIGYELSPFMWLIAWVRALRYPRAHIYFGNFYKQDLARHAKPRQPAGRSVVFAFLMPQNMDRVRRFLTAQTIPGGKYFLSYTFPFKDYEPLKVIRAPQCGPVYIYDLQELTKK